MTQIMCVTPSAGAGWAPVTTMAQLMSRCLEAPLRLVHPARDYSRARRLLSLVPRRRGSKGHLILVAARPGDLLAMVGGAGHLKGFDSVSAWIFDAFWDDEIPRMARRATFGCQVGRRLCAGHPHPGHLAAVGDRLACRWGRKLHDSAFRRCAAARTPAPCMGR